MLTAETMFFKRPCLPWRDTPFPPFSPSLISLMVTIDVKHHVCLLIMERYVSYKVMQNQDNDDDGDDDEKVLYILLHWPTSETI